MHLLAAGHVASSMRIALLPAALLLAGFDFVPPHKALAAPDPVFHAEDFFLGRTDGKGVVKQAFSKRSNLVVQGMGHVDGDGTLVLDQIVRRDGGTAEKRQWRIRKASPGRYTGTLTDARGIVSGEVRGNCLHLKYTLNRAGMSVDQYIYLQPGGRVALNRMTVKKIGITFATIEETIRRVG